MARPSTQRPARQPAKVQWLLARTAAPGFGLVLGTGKSIKLREGGRYLPLRHRAIAAEPAVKNLKAQHSHGV